MRCEDLGHTLQDRAVTLPLLLRPPDPRPNAYRSRCSKYKLPNLTISLSPHDHHSTTTVLHIPIPSPPLTSHLPFTLNNPQSPAPASYAFHVSEDQHTRYRHIILPPLSCSFAPHSVSDTQRGSHGPCISHENAIDNYREQRRLPGRFVVLLKREARGRGSGGRKWFSILAWKYLSWV